MFQWCSDSHDLSWWVPECMMHWDISPYNRSTVARGITILNSSLTFASWGVPLITEVVRHSCRGSKNVGGSNVALYLVIPFWQAIHISFKMIVLRLCCACVWFPGRCSHCITTTWKWRSWWISLSWDPLLSDAIHSCCLFFSDYSEGERLR